jgi:hypothetical protein
MTTRDLKRTAATHQAVVVDESSGRWTVYQIEAPEGKLWVDGWTPCLRVEWRTGDAPHREDSLQDAVERMDCGLTDAED